MPAKKKTSSKKAPAKRGAVAKKQQTALAVAIDANDAGAGLEGADQDSFAIPILRILQSNSPQCEEADGEFIEGARPGMLFNSATSELIDPREDEVYFLHCSFRRAFLRWAPRGADNGYRGEYTPEEINDLVKSEEIVNEDGRLYFTEDGKFLGEKKSDRAVDTRSHFGILITPNGNTPVLFPLASTQVKKSKRLMSILNAARIEVDGRQQIPPTWLNRIQIETVPESNDEGNWMGVSFTSSGFVEDQDLYDMGKVFHDQITSGKFSVNYEAGSGAASEDEENF